MEGLRDAIESGPPLLAVIALTFLPIFELRASIPYGYLVANMPLALLLPVVVLVNWLVAPVMYFFMRYVLKFVRRWGWFDRAWERYTQRAQRRAEKAMESWGSWGLALFIGIPLPGSGVYTGAVVAFVLGMRFRKFVWVALGGVCIAAFAVTLVVVSGSELFSWMANHN